MPAMIARSHLLSSVRRIRSQTVFFAQHQDPSTRSSFSSSSSSSDGDGPKKPSQYALLQFRSCRLGLDPLIQSQLEQIEQLPEIATALSTPQPDATTLSALQRALDIFEPMGGEPYHAVLALMAETQCAVAGAQDEANYAACLDTIWKIQDLSTNEPAVVELALAKAHWLNGEFATAKGICDTLVEDNADTHSMQVAARTGQAVSRLCAVKSKDDVFSVRDPFRMAFKRQEHAPRNSHTALAAACLNAGVAEAVWAETVQKYNEMEVPLDAAMRMWNTGLSALQRAKRHKTNPELSETVRALLEARLHTNMAWGMLHMPSYLKSTVQEASDYAGKALAVYDKNPALKDNKEGMITTLSLVATCYHKSGGAVTAEGLFQSALDQPIHSPLQRLERRDALKRYADLCREWDKREGEAKKLLLQADEVDASLPAGWRGKSLLHASLWFWTPTLFDC